MTRDVNATSTTSTISGETKKKKVSKHRGNFHPRVPISIIVLFSTCVEMFSVCLQRRNDREEIRRRLAMGPDAEDLRVERGRKPSLQSRLQSGSYRSNVSHEAHLTRRETHFLSAKFFPKGTKNK